MANPASAPKKAAAQPVPRTNTKLEAWLRTNVDAEELYDPLFKRHHFKCVEDLLRYRAREGEMKFEEVIKDCAKDDDVVLERLTVALDAFVEEHQPKHEPGPPEKKSDPDAEENKKKREQLLKAQKEAEDARKEALDAALKGDEAMKTKANESLRKLVADLKSDMPQLPDLTVQSKTLEADLQAMTGGLKGLIEAIPKSTMKLTAAGLVNKLGLLHGFRIDASGAGTPAETAMRLLDMPVRLTEADEPEAPNLEEAFLEKSFASQELEQSFSKTVSTLGRSLAVETSASGAAFVGIGIAAMSLGVRYGMAHQEEHQSSEAQSTATSTRSVTHYWFAPKGLIRLADEGLPKMSKSAAAAIDAIAREDTPGERRKAVLTFFTDYGTHFFANVLLGGYYQHVARATARNSEWTTSMMNALTTAKQLAVSASASYAGLCGAAKAAMGTSLSTTDSTADIKNRTYKFNQTDIQVETRVLGGTAAGLPMDLWRASLEYSDNWKALGGEVIFPVWELVEDAELKGLFENVWVKDVFIPKLPADVAAALAGVETTEKLESTLTVELDKQLARLKPRSLVVRDWRVHAVERLGQPVIAPLQPGCKLIGGGARVDLEKVDGACNVPVLLHSSPDVAVWQLSLDSRATLEGSALGERNEGWYAVANKIDPKQPADMSWAMAVWAILLVDPAEEWDIQIRKKKSEPGLNPEVDVYLDDDFVRTGGGAAALPHDPKGYSLLTASCPKGDHGWHAESLAPGVRDWGWVKFPGRASTVDSATVEAFVIGIRPRSGPPPIAMVRSGKAAVNPALNKFRAFAEATLEEGFVLTGGGASLAGGVASDAHLFLTELSPDPDRRAFRATATVVYEQSGQELTAYAIGVKMPKA